MSLTQRLLPRTLASRARFRARRIILDSSRLAARHLAWRRAYEHRQLTMDTELVVDGFPRSANSYFFHAFNLAQGRDIKLAGHAHSAGLLVNAVTAQIPSVLVIREPLPVLSSYLQFSPDLTPMDILISYRRFHEKLRPVLDHVYIASFTLVTSDMGAVVQGINEKFGTDFVPYVHNPDNERHVREALDAVSIRRTGGHVLEHRVSRPSASRVAPDVTAGSLSTRERRALARAQDTYASIMRHTRER